ncbi:hypothetical protein A5658_04770 [Mycobacterium sp. 1245111.1]|uniref:hypothetical protein n=1 Tax=Mycobacterium sp. 1245111.1 TaxID=1834073 RepID=UPI0007FFDB2E|nr:hypothetical protein [Mycobacterium sp. 1245111.1]OBK36976.1 hypothetical protein A5658_04770 [Mycobacterium sp. 1245111.1]
MSLDETLREHFAGVSTAEIIRRINRAPDFGYDDEEYELNRRLTEQSLTWKWVRGDSGHQVVEVFNPQTGQPAAFR